MVVWEIYGRNSSAIDPTPTKIGSGLDRSETGLAFRVQASKDPEYPFLLLLYHFNKQLYGRFVTITLRII